MDRTGMNWSGERYVTKMLLHHLKMKGNNSEYNTSQVCGICHTRYDAYLHAALEMRKQRFRVRDEKKIS